MLISLLVLTLALLAGALALPRLVVAPPAFWAHLILAVGIMGLVTAAVQHFTPVLTRGRGAGTWMGRLPWLMVAAGVLVSATLLGLLAWTFVSLAAVSGLAGALAMAVWMRARGRRAVGGPHPGLAWYVAAMGCLAAGLAAAALIPFAPHWHAVLAAFHLHVNLYGFVGLTAVGTLQVLMPTAAGAQDPEAGRRLRQDLKWGLAGSLLLAVGKAAQAGGFEPGLGLAWAGAAAWAWVLGRMVLAWLRRFGRRCLALHGVEPVLLAATLGFAGSLAGALGWRELPGPLAIFLPGFLFPLITGAAGQLAPVWVRPGRQTPWHDESHKALGRWGGVRALLFLTAAVLPLLGYKCSGMPALLALFWFGALFSIWLYRD